MSSGALTIANRKPCNSWYVSVPAGRDDCSRKAWREGAETADMPDSVLLGQAEHYVADRANALGQARLRQSEPTTKGPEPLVEVLRDRW